MRLHGAEQLHDKAQRPRCRKESPAAALRLPRRASPPHWPFHLGQAYRVRSRLRLAGACAEPEVRIHLPPAGSLRTFGSSSRSR
jgi:hypothetical protein